MLKKTIHYTDFNGNERDEDFFFNLTNAEIVELELSTKGGLTETVQQIINTQDSTQLVQIFKDIILKAYGEKSADGKRFVKVDEDGKKLAINFMQTEAYSVLFMELATDAKAAADFINGIVPSNAKQNMATKELITEQNN